MEQELADAYFIDGVWTDKRKTALGGFLHQQWQLCRLRLGDRTFYWGPIATVAKKEDAMPVEANAGYAPPLSPAEVANGG